MMVYLRLFWEFFKTGLFAIGGGMAAIPFLYKMSDDTGWFTYDDLTNMIAVSESTPGPIGANMATYVGFTAGMDAGGGKGAVLGAMVATLGLVVPSMILVLAIAAFLQNFRDNRYLNGAFYGLRPASTGLIAAAGLSLVMSNLFIFEGRAGSVAINWKGWILAAVLWLLTNKVKGTKNLHPVVFIGVSAVCGILFSMG